MRIAVNTQTLVENKMEGLGWYTYENLRRIVEAHPEHEFVFIFGKGIVKNFLFAPNVTAVNIGPPFNRPLAWLLKFEFLLPRFINRGNFDLFLSPDGWSSNKIKCKTVCVIHDINFEHYPEFLPWSFIKYYQYFFKRWVKHADRIATVSEYSKNDIVKTYGTSPNKIDVTYNGASNKYVPLSEEQIAETRDKYTNGSPYFIFIGALHARKNIINQLKAFDAFKKNNKNNTKFVIVGEKFMWSKETENAFNALIFKDEVIFTGRLAQDELKYALGASLALCYVSLFEGFGIPIVEAMSCNIPVITSNTTSMPEIAGTAALIVDPFNIEEISEAMYTLSTNENKRQALIDSGNKRKLDFSWEQTSEKLWNCIEKVLKSN